MDQRLVAQEDSSGIKTVDNRISAIDGLRALAISLVFLYHLGPKYLPGGFVGVDVFFAISGFLITSLLAREFSQTGKISLKQFYARRILRIWPALTVLLIVAAIASLYFPISDLDLALAALSGMNWARAFEWPTRGYLGHTWSLSIEEQFYLIWPLLILVLLRIGKLRLVTIFATVSIVACLIWRVYLSHFASTDRLYNGSDTRADAILFGCLIAAISLEKIRTVASKLWFIPFLFLVAIALAVPQTSLWLEQFGLTLIGIAASWLIIAATNQEHIAAKLLSLPAVVYVGRISYSLYLWHYPINRALIDIGLVPFIRAPAATALSVAAAIVSYHVVELPFLRIGKRLHNRNTTSPTPKFKQAKHTSSH